MSCVGIYGIINDIDGKIYVGQTVDFARREKAHWIMLRGGRHPNNHLQRAFTKYGRENFRFAVLCECLPEELVEKEQFWLDAYPSKAKYNQADSAKNSMLGRKHTPEARAKMSAKLKGKRRTGWRHSPEAIENMRKAKLGKKMSRTTRRKMRQARLGFKQSPEAIEKIRLAKLGKPRSEETKEKIRQAKLGKKLSKEHAEHIRQSLIGKTLSEETRQKISIAHTGKKKSDAARQNMRKPKSPEAKAAMKAAALARWQDPEFRARMLEVRRKRFTPKKYNKRT